MSVVARSFLILLIVGLVAVVPIVHYRDAYSHQKRFRTVTPGTVYRSGQLTQEGFEDVIRKYDIKTVINLQDDVPNPELPRTCFDRSTVREREFCEKHGVRYVHVAPDLLPPREVPARRPKAVDQFLMVMDELNAHPDKHLPVLIHCRAGLHRTGCMVAIYRMEHENWTPAEAYEEMRAHGFGNKTCTSANEYVRQYVLSYQHGKRNDVPLPQGWSELVLTRWPKSGDR